MANPMLEIKNQVEQVLGEDYQVVEHHGAIHIYNQGDSEALLSLDNVGGLLPSVFQAVAVAAAKALVEESAKH